MSFYFPDHSNIGFRFGGHDYRYCTLVFYSYYCSKFVMEASCTLKMSSLCGLQSATKLQVVPKTGVRAEGNSLSLDHRRACVHNRTS